MSRDKSVWFAEEIVLDGALIHYKLEAGEWVAVEEMLRAEAQLSRDPETGRVKPKKANEYTLRLIGEFLHMMRLNLDRDAYRSSSLAVAEQCLRLIRSCAAYGMKIQTYICKDLNILEDMLSIFTKYQEHCEVIVNDQVMRRFDSCMVTLTQTLGNLVVNNPFNQIIIWDRFGTNILNALVGQDEKVASCCAMIVYNILLGQPNVLPDDVSLLNALAYMYADGNSEFPHLIIEYLIGVESTYIEKLYNRLESDTRLLILNLVYNILTGVETQDSNVSVNFIKFISHEFKVKSDCILKTVDKYVNSVEPQEVVYLLDIIASASCMDAYMDCLQNDISLFINCAFLLRSIHKLGKQEDNFFSSINKLYTAAGKTMPSNRSEVFCSESTAAPVINESGDYQVKKCDSSDLLQCNETVSECTESESSEQYFECNEQSTALDKLEQAITESTMVNIVENTLVESGIANVPVALPESRPTIPFLGSNVIDPKTEENLINVAFAKSSKAEPALPVNEHVHLNSKSDSSLPRKHSLDQKTDNSDELEPPLITDSPEEIIQSEQKKNSINLTRKISLDVNIGRKDNYPASTFISGNIVRSVSRQQSVERAVEASESNMKEITASLQQDPKNNPAVVVQKQPETTQTIPTEPSAQNVEPAQTKSTIEPPPVKKNISSEFDLNEQLQKILGISTDKAPRNEASDSNKDSHNTAAQKNVEVQPSAGTSQVPTSLSAAAQSVEPEKTPKPKVQMMVPNVKIQSPESAQKLRINAIDQSGPKNLHTMVESVEQHVAFGFKATLIRTLGNLCWKNQINKRQIRELEVIPVLLDCCNIDARNPLIMQWVILAVRNLCENCPENQAIISSLTLQDPIDNEILNEMGLTLHADTQKNTIKLVPLLKK